MEIKSGSKIYKTSDNENLQIFPEKDIKNKSGHLIVIHYLSGELGHGDSSQIRKPIKSDKVAEGKLVLTSRVRNVRPYPLTSILHNLYNGSASVQCLRFVSPLRM